jgi:hypothetical protein
MDESMDRERIDIEAELAAAADESLSAERRAALLGEVAASSELTLALERQRRALAAVRAVDVAAPEPLRRAVAGAVEAAAARPRRRRLPRPALGSGSGARPRLLVAMGGALAVVALVLAVVLPGGGASAPTVQEAARVALRTAVAPAPSVRPDGRALVATVDGIAYPTWDRVGWSAAGERMDTLAGHRLRTVFYTNARGARIGYAIADGRALPVAGGRVVERRGAYLRVLAVDGATVVTWHRDGHTCILAARGVDVARLLALASYST